MFSRRSPAPPSGAPDRRAYVVGDVHGRLDLLTSLLDKIHADIAERPKCDVLLVFVGDLIDRGPSSAQVVELLRTYDYPGVRPIFLLGNHEEVLLRILEGDASLIRNWLTFGGAECLQSYGGNPEQLTGLPDADAIAAIRAAVPPAHVEFLGEFVDTCRFGDYLFVHAGIRPGISVEEQSQSDLRWIREPFLFDDSNHGLVVVHGHTIRPEVEEKANRIGIDTGAFATGVLTAVAIEGVDRWFIDTRVSEGTAVPAAH